MGYEPLANQDFIAPLVNQTIGTVVWIGLLILTIAFFVMSWTRLGQARPLTKCLVLSLFAHLLLVIFFYGIELLGIRGESAAMESVQISIVDDTLFTVSNVADNEEVVEATEVIDSANRSESAEAEPIRPLEVSPTTLADVAEPVQTEETKTEVKETGLDLENTDPVGEVNAGEPESQSVESQLEPGAALHEETPVNSVSPADIRPHETAVVAEVIVPETTSIPSPEPLPLARTDGTALPTRYRQRFPVATEQQQAVKGSRFGATRDTEASVQAALLWLVNHQENDGHWDASLHGSGVDREVDGQKRVLTGAKADTGITGLAVLALMGAGNTHLEGGYCKTVQRGLEFLLARQNSQGSLAGDATMFARMYCHAMATIAVCEAYAMTRDDRLRRPAEKAVRYTLSCQDQVTGGWRYQPADPGDMSQFGWQVLALQSAEQAEMDIPVNSVQLMKKFLRSCNAGTYRGLASYRPGFGATHTMTAESLACRFWLTTEDEPRQIREASKYLMQRLPAMAQPDFYYWYYGSLSLRQVGGEDWETWVLALKRTLPAMQRTDGSWSANTKWGGYGGTVYSTAMGALCLESFYRYQ